MHFNPEKSLFELPIVRWIGGISFGVATLCAVVIASNSDLVPSLGFEAFNESVVIFKVPLGILALGLTLIGICGANHRSEQTKRQIERTSKQIVITDNQNRFSNHYKHLEEFTKYAQLCYGRIESDSSRELYQLIFPDSTKGDFAVSESFLSNFFAYAFRTIQALEQLDTPDHSDFLDAIVATVKLRETFMKTNHIKDKDLSGSRIERNGVQVLIPGGNIQSLFEHIVLTFKFVDLLLKFDLQYRPPELCKSIILMRTGNLNSWQIGNGSWEPIVVGELLYSPTSS